MIFGEKESRRGSTFPRQLARQRLNIFFPSRVARLNIWIASTAEGVPVATRNSIFFSLILNNHKLPASQQYFFSQKISTNH